MSCLVHYICNFVNLILLNNVFCNVKSTKICHCKMATATINQSVQEQISRNCTKYIYLQILCYLSKHFGLNIKWKKPWQFIFCQKCYHIIKPGHLSITINNWYLTWKENQRRIFYNYFHLFTFSNYTSSVLKLKGWPKILPEGNLESYRV